MKTALTTAVALALLLSCPAQARKQRRLPEPPPRPELEHPIAEPEQAAPGSLWSEVTGRSVMGLDGNQRRAGDLVTVRIVESVATDIGATTDTSRSSSNKAAIDALLGIEKTLKKAHKNLEDIGIDVSTEAAFSGAGNTARTSAVQATLTCEVLEVLPTGNLRIWGYKQVMVNRETQYVVLHGLARPRDIQLDNTVSSELLAQATIEITGSGVVSDRQGQGWGARVLDFIWPF